MLTKKQQNRRNNQRTNGKIDCDIVLIVSYFCFFFIGNPKESKNKEAKRT